MPDDKKPAELMALMLAELKSLNRTLRILAGHLMDMAEASPRPEREAIRVLSDELPQSLPDPLLRRIREIEPERREQLLGELRRALEGC